MHGLRGLSGHLPRQRGFADLARPKNGHRRERLQTPKDDLNMLASRNHERVLYYEISAADTEIS